MALTKRIYPLVVDGGLNTKVDEKLVQPGESLVLENVDFDEIGSIRKRTGFDKLADDTSDLSTVSSKYPVGLFEHGSELIALGKCGTNDFYSYNQQSSTWNKKTGELISPFVFIEDKFADRINSFSPSLAEIPSKNMRVVAYLTYDENSISPHYQIKVFTQDYATKEKKQIYSLSLTVVTYNVQIKVYDQANPVIFLMYTKAVGANLQLFVSTMDVNGSSFVITSLNTYPVATAILGYNSCFVGNQLFIIQDYSNVNKLYAYLIGLDGLVDDSLEINTVDTKNAAATFQTCFACLSYGTNVLFAFNNNDNVDPLTMIGLETSGGLAINFAELSYGAGTALLNASKIIISLVESNTKVLTVWQTFTNSFNGDIKINTVSIAGHAQLTHTDLYQAMKLSSSFFSLDSGNDRYFIGQSDVLHQERYHLCKLTYSGFSISVIGAFAINGQAISSKKVMLGATSIATSRDNILLPDVLIGKDDNYYYTSLYATREIKLSKDIDTDAANLIASVFVNRIEFESEYQGITAKLGESTLIAGSMAREYDGIKLLEQSFVDGNFLLLTETANAGMDAGTYSYTGIYEYIDANGQIHRSAPFPVRTITTVGNHSISIDYLHPETPSKGIASATKNYNMVLYRTEKNGGVYYRLGTGNKTQNLYGISTVPHEDSELNTAIISSEQIYNQNGILDNDSLPPSKFLLVANGRVFAILSEDENVVAFSQSYFQGECVNFTGANTFRTDLGLLSRSGKAVALGCIDAKIIILKDQSIAYISGSGPNQAGEQNDFTDPKLISSDVGIADVKSLVSIPDGLMFKSNKGIYLLDRSLQLSYIGYPVEDYNNEKIVGTANVVDNHKVLFMTANRTLAYDYLQKKWNVWTTKGNYLTTYNKLPVYIDSDYRVRIQNKSSYLDDTERYSMKIVTPWIKLSGIQNYQRIYKLMILGQFFSAHTLEVKSYYDYDDTDFDTYPLSPLITDEIYQYDISIIKQKGQAMKFEISDTSVAGSNQSCKLTNLSMILGQKKGTNKTPDDRKY